jgi:hypothetical protein
MNNDFLYSRFCSDISQAINITDIKQIIYLINSDTYAAISLTYKETQAFTSAYVGHNRDLLNYFIFDYNINEKAPLELILTMNELTINILDLQKLKVEVLKMFEVRKLSKEIKAELDINHKGNKKPKA